MSEPGMCYQLAATAVMDDLLDLVRETFDCPTDVRLVHGYPIGTGGDVEGVKYGHAWVECSAGGLTLVYDPSAEIVIPAFLYYDVGRIDPDECQYYELDDIRQRVLVHEHWGPWDDVPENVAFSENISEFNPE